MKLRQLLKLKSLRWGLALTAAGLLGTLSHALFTPDDQPIAAAGALDFSTYDLSGGTAVAFRGDYIRATWDGDLVAYNTASNGGQSIKWRASERLALQGWNIRKIATHNGTAGSAFEWGSLTSAQQTALGGATSGLPMLEYLRGDSSKELTATNPSGVYKQRFSRVGAVIHSRPYYRKQGSDASGNPIGRVYVGANDGMLHTFDAATGDEVFAYVPSMLFNKLKDLSVPSPTTFKYYVDGLMAIADVPKTGGGTSTLLVSGLGGGAKGLFALDISNPAPATVSDVAAMAKWELTGASTGYANLGNVYAAPQIVKLNTGVTAALVPNGANSGGGVSSLFVINVDTGALLGEISAGTGPDNGLGGIAAVDLNRNGTVDVVYAGDLKGTLWKFNLSGTTLPSAATAVLTPAGATARPITATPSVIAHPRGGVLVNFGTGRVYDSADMSSTTTEYLYGIWDGAGATTSTLATPALQDVALSVAGVTKNYRAVGTSSVNYAGGDKGWRVSLTGGERLLGGDTITDSGRYAVTTTIPNAGSTQGAWYLQLDALTGGAPSAPFFDLNGDGVVNKSDASDKLTVGGSPVVPVGKFLGSGVWSQPVLARMSATSDLPFFNRNANTVAPVTTTTTTTVPPVPPGERGVYGGHFDFDIYYNACNALSGSYSGGCASNTHKHEYDDTYDVVGVNMLNASLPAFNLGNAIAGTATKFKILVVNTNWSPAARLKIMYPAGADPKLEPAVDLDTEFRNWPVTPEGFLANPLTGAAQEFTRTNLTFIYYLPVTAFTNKDWRGNGDVRAGLIPSKTGCVRANTGGQGSATGPWMNGALTIQIVKNTTTGASVEATVPADAGGYRLKKDATAQPNQLAQYTAFWHHPNGKCFADVGWTKAPPPDASGSSGGSTPAANSADPTGQFLVGENGTAVSGQAGSTTTSVTYNGELAVLTRTLTAGGVLQTINKGVASGLALNTTLLPWGTTDTGSLQASPPARTGRLGWRELVR